MAPLRWTTDTSTVDPLSPHSGWIFSSLSSRAQTAGDPDTASPARPGLPTVHTYIKVLVGLHLVTYVLLVCLPLGMTSLVIRNLVCPPSPSQTYCIWQQTPTHQSYTPRRLGKVPCCSPMARYPVHVHVHIHAINSIRRCYGRLSPDAALQFHFCGLSQSEQPVLLEESHHVQLLRLCGIEEAQCLGCFATTGPLQSQEGKVATYDRPGLELETAWVSPFSLGLVEISKRLVYSIELVHGHFLFIHREH